MRETDFRDQKLCGQRVDLSLQAPVQFRPMHPPLPVRAIHVVSSVAEEASGTTYAVAGLCQALRACGGQISLATLDAHLPSSPQLAGLSHHGFRPGLGPRSLGRAPALHGWLRKQAASDQVDILHSHGLWQMPNVYPGRVSAASGVPLVVSPHGMLSPWAMQRGSRLKRLFWPLLQLPSFAAAACFHATSLSEYEDIRRAGFRQPVALVPIGIDVPELPPRRPASPRTLLFLGRIHPKKGLDMLLPAWQRVEARFPQWRLLVVGPDEGGYLAVVQRLAATLQLQRVEFRSALYGPQKWEAYRQADLFVLPTYSENFGLAIAEALAAGTPAIVTRGAPWPELAARGAGWWIDVGTEALRTCLETALACPVAELGAMGNRGRHWMEAEFTWTPVGQRMLQTYQWLKGRAPRPEFVIVS